MTQACRISSVSREPVSVSARHLSASVRAITPCELIAVDKRRFLSMLQQTPFFAVRVMRVLARRLRTMNERMTQL